MHNTHAFTHIEIAALSLRSIPVVHTKNYMWPKFIFVFLHFAHIQLNTSDHLSFSNHSCAGSKEANFSTWFLSNTDMYSPCSIDKNHVVWRPKQITQLRQNQPICRFCSHSINPITNQQLYHLWVIALVERQRHCLV